MAMQAFWTGPKPSLVKSYSTNFSDAPQSPISQGGVWHHTPNFCANIITVTSPNRAVGTQTGSDGFNDSYAYLGGFAPNVQAQATVYKDPTIDTTLGEHEVELLFRWGDSGTTAFGYECNFSSVGGYANIVRWNGAKGDFDILDFGPTFTAPSTGDIVMATCVTVGGVVTITSYIKYLAGGGFNQLTQVTDSTWLTGQPGIGMWLQDAAFFGNQQKYAFTDYAVTEI